MRLSILLLVGGCACVAPEGRNDRDAYVRHMDALSVALRANGYQLPTAPDWGSLHVTTVDGPRACGKHLACLDTSGVLCPHIRVRKDSVDDAMHELLHWVLLDTAGLSTPGHDQDFPGFDQVVFDAAEVYRYETARTGGGS